MRKSDLEQLRAYGISPSDILLPGPGSDYYKWAVVACDQYTSQKEYWQDVELITENHPTTYQLIYPECYLEEDDKDKRIAEIDRTMNEYLQKGFFKTYPECFILVERTTESGTRYGLMASLDLECYSYAPDSKTLIRATEGTILSRIPPRKEIRKNAPLELPHIMVLINDSKRGIIEPLVAKRAELECVYDTELMKKGGHVKGYLVNSDEDIECMIRGFEVLHKALNPENPLLFAMGDGNHSLATAKSCWEDIKKTLSVEERKNHPARYALVELENIFDPALLFEPIHRVFFNLERKTFEEKLIPLASSFTATEVKDLETLEEKINAKGEEQRFGVVNKEGYFVYSLKDAKHSIAAGTLQSVIDHNDFNVDYIHGADVTESLGKEKGNLGIILPDVSKETFFEAIIKDKAFPRKTFSIGHANEKRFYMEAKRIR